MAKLSCVLTIVALLLCCIVCSVTSESNQSPAERAKETTSYLYDAVRKIAFPASAELDEEKENVENRFILLMPGKTLNYLDYYPGPEYTDFIQNPNKNMKFAIVPPHTMENWFDLADVIPSANPLGGQDTGRSLATIYRQILEQTTIKNLEEQGEQVEAFYNQAIGFLNEEVPDPENLKVNTTRLALYDKYKEEYNKQKLEMEDEIEKKRKNLRYIDYELWFQRHYPSLISKVESSYIQWLIMGQKEMCDIYITYLDTGASAKALEEARIVLRSAGVASLDRTRTIYPVDFEPSDWYKYLLPLTQKPSSAELQDMLSKINTQIQTIDGTIHFYQTTNEKFDEYARNLEARKDSQAQQKSNTLSSYLQKELECTVQNMGVNATENSCEDMMVLSQNLTSALNDESESRASVGEYTWSPTNKEAYIRSLMEQKDNLQRQRELVQASLGKVDPLVGGILNMDSLAVASLIDSHKDDQWMHFEFDSEDYRNNEDYRSTHQHIDSSRSTGLPGFWGTTRTFQHTQDTSSYQSSLAKASLKVKGKFLRVFIKRPWFKPEFFDDRNLNFIGNTPNNIRVLGAPGKELSEKAFIAAITKEDIIYRLPEYVTSFLLARDMEMEFSELDGKAFRDTVSIFTSETESTTRLLSSATNTKTSSNYESKSKVHRTASGMKIKIAGAQVIGYYTQKLPKFPETVL